LTYSIGIERGDLNYNELEPNYRRHYAEMKERLARDCIEISDYNPRLDQYFNAFRGGWLINYVARFNGQPVGHSNIYLTNDMHNGDFIAQEDMIYVVPEHRNGLGRKLARYVLDDLQSRGVTRLSILAVTDLRAEKLWRRMGFKPAAQMMTFTF
jgi:GNAT superfamily N-acetyltransferase